MGLFLVVVVRKRKVRISFLEVFSHKDVERDNIRTFFLSNTLFSHPVNVVKNCTMDIGCFINSNVNEVRKRVFDSLIKSIRRLPKDMMHFQGEQIIL